MKRARDSKGRFIKDDPSTPEVNEAYVMSKAPVASKHALKSKGIWGGLIAAVAGAILAWTNQHDIEVNGAFLAGLELLSFIGGALAVWGRAKADAPVHFNSAVVTKSADGEAVAVSPAPEE